MGYDAPWEREIRDRIFRVAEAIADRIPRERGMHPNKRLDEVGWEIFYWGVFKDMAADDAARLALDGALRRREAVRDDLVRRVSIDLDRRYGQLHPEAHGLYRANLDADEQLRFWRSRNDVPSFVYFIQQGDSGPVKIGLSKDPERRLPQLQTGNPRDLRLRHVLPGDRGAEEDLHERFALARIRGEWFGREYLPFILAFAAGLSEQMVTASDASGEVPQLHGIDVMTDADITRLRLDMQTHLSRGVSLTKIAEYTMLPLELIQAQVEEMRQNFYWRPTAHYGHVPTVPHHGPRLPHFRRRIRPRR